MEHLIINQFWRLIGKVVEKYITDNFVCLNRYILIFNMLDPLVYTLIEKYYDNFAKVHESQRFHLQSFVFWLLVEI